MLFGSYSVTDHASHGPIVTEFLARYSCRMSGASVKSLAVSHRSYKGESTTHWTR